MRFGEAKGKVDQNEAKEKGSCPHGANCAFVHEAAAAPKRKGQKEN